MVSTRAADRDFRAGRRLSTLAPAAGVLVRRGDAFGDDRLSQLGIVGQPQIPVRVLVLDDVYGVLAAARATRGGPGDDESLAHRAVHAPGRGVEAVDARLSRRLVLWVHAA